jgi:quinolinate synthase
MIVEDLILKIKELKTKKNALILAHYYQRPEIQDIADYVGDSLALAQHAVKAKSSYIILCGVKFMAETAKILNPNARVFLPNLDAGCSLADSCDVESYKKFIEPYPDGIKITYINSSVDVKILSDIIVTSSNAKRIVEAQPIDKPILFAPDQHLGRYIQSTTHRKMILFPGQCHVHSQIETQEILKLKVQYPYAKIIVHPECTDPILKIADFVGSTSALLKYVAQSSDHVFIVGTEIGILHQMKKIAPDKTFLTVSDSKSSCSCSECEYMKSISLTNVLDVLENEINEIILDEETIHKASIPLMRMLSYG